MKSLSTVVAVCTVSFTFSAVHAQQLPQTRGGLIDGSPVIVSSQERFVMPNGDLGAFQGQFQMADGTTLTVTRKNRRLFAAVTGQPEVELIATARNAFVSVKGAVHLVFQQAENGNVFGVEMRRTGNAA